jgi:hypothetical protein
MIGSVETGRAVVAMMLDVGVTSAEAVSMVLHVYTAVQC